MKYMVMECHPGYAVVLGEDGKFRKVANIHFEVGQTVTGVVPLNLPERVEQPANRRYWFSAVAAMAACLLLVVGMMFFRAPYASVYLTINPEVRVDVDRHDRVVGVEGMNADGVALLEGYDYKKKPLDTVMDELVDRAIAMGYLHEGGKVTLTLDAEDDEWVISHTDSLSTHLNAHLADQLSVTIEIGDQHSHSITIPIDDDDGGDDRYDDGGDDTDHDDDHDDDIDCGDDDCDDDDDDSDDEGDDDDDDD